MVQVIENAGSASGRIGRAFGQGLAESVPKEIDRYRLSQGLKQFEQESANLTPMQQLARLSSIPGITPQTIQSFAELAKQQNVRNNLSKSGNTEKPVERDRSPIEKPQKGQQLEVNQNIHNRRTGKLGSLEDNGERTPNVRPEQDLGPNQINNLNPLREAAIPRKPWTSEKRNQAIADNFDLVNNIDTARQMALDDERRYLSQPKAEQEIDAYKEGVKTKAVTDFKDKLKQVLQHDSETGIFNDISGEDLNNMERGLNRDISMLGNSKDQSSVDDVINDWATRGLNFAKTKKEVTSKATKWPSLFKEAYRKSLIEYGDIYKKAGNSEEYFKTLQTGFGMSPEGAASIAYPRGKRFQEYVNKLKPSSMHSDHESNARKIADDLETLGILPNDSLLALAYDLKQKDPNFDQQSFFEQLSDDKDTFGFNSRQGREIAEGLHRDVLPNWGDILVLPVLRGL